MGRWFHVRPNKRVIAIGLVATVVLLMFILRPEIERRYLFFPRSEISYTPERLGIGYEDIYFTTSDGLRLNGWYVPGTNDVTWLWFHGNGGNISHRVEEIALINDRLGVNLFIIDYRGYGQSQGRPSEKGTYLDARAALEYLQGRPDVDPEKIVYFGRSLGAAVAVELATFRPPMALVLVSPFASVKEMARVSVPYLPVYLLVGNSYDSLARIRQVHCPVLVLHGDRDTIVPLSQGEKLFEAANRPKRFEIVPGAGHNDTFFDSMTVYWDTLAEFLTGLPAGQPDLSYGDGR